MNSTESSKTKLAYAEEDIAALRSKIDTIDKKIEVLRSEQSAIDTKTRDAMNGIVTGEAKYERM